MTTKDANNITYFQLLFDVVIISAGGKVLDQKTGWTNFTMDRSPKFLGVQTVEESHAVTQRLNFIEDGTIIGRGQIQRCIKES